jgi:bifunctional non-homologous end joining protein LigD
MARARRRGAGRPSGGGAAPGTGVPARGGDGRAPRRAGRAARPPALPPAAALIPPHLPEAIVDLGGRRVALTNLRKTFFPALGLTKGDLIRYYLEISPVLLPHLCDRPMVMRRYPDGAEGASFFMKRAPAARPEWLALCPVAHREGVIEFPMIQDLPSLLWVVNLGCIDLNPWYARCDDPDRPDYLHFDLDPLAGAPFARVREAALIVREALAALGMPSWAKTTGSRGMHVSVPIARGPTQHRVWTVAKALARELAARHPAVLTAEYAPARRPAGRVLVDYNQNAGGRTLASVYSVRPTPRAAVSTPVTWREVARGVAIEDFRIDNVPGRVRRLGDLWAPLLARRGRVALDRLVGTD